DEPLAVALEVGADEVARGAFQHADDAAGRRRVAVRRLAQDADEDGVAGDGVEGVALADAHLGADLSLDGGRTDVAGAARGAAERVDDAAVRRGGAQGVVLCQLDASVAQQVLEGAAEVAVLVGGYAEPPGERLRLERRVALAADGGEDLLFVRWH